VNGRYPYEWSDEQRGKAVAQDIIEPLAITLLSSSIGNGAAHGTSEGTASEASDTVATSGFIG